MEGGLVLERSLHQHFDKYRIRGEWFKPNPELETFIEARQIGFSVYTSNNLDELICAICGRELGEDDLVQGLIKQSIDAFRCQIEPETYIFCCV